MDAKLVREQAIAATTRYFCAKQGFEPDPDSEEWEVEYRRQFDLAKARLADVGPESGDGATAASSEPANLAELTGAPTQIRWAAALRIERLHEIGDPGVRDWLATTWAKAKSWIDTRELPTPVFLQRVAPHYAEFRKKAGEQARISAAARREQQNAAETLRREVAEAGITVAGLIELIDIADRLPPVPLQKKLAELDDEGRNLRVFDTADPAMLMVLEKSKDSRSEYGIERDDGLVADLLLFARAKELL